ncbi:MAG TPA: tetratricopeptide repeat protein [Steroidobacteraceae bacterium]|jgi:tetratricopeptide (TPR) repeat protein
MPELTAFVGHSFQEKDKPLVDRFLEMLGTVQKLMPDFTWENAQAAEPKELSKKVREKMEGKNLFIGICTAREEAIESAKIRAPWWLPKGTVIAERAELRVKTADWILQEIGMAVGLNMEMILLLEEGVRKPGGLQGDLEYISFSRDKPEQCLTQFTSMLRTLSPKPAAAARAEPAKTESSASEVNDEFVDEYTSPQPNWTADVYISRYRFAITIRDKDRQQTIAQAFRDSNLSLDPNSAVAFDSAQISVRAAAYKESWLNDLNRLSRANPHHFGPYLGLAERFADADEHEQAAANYERAAEFANNPNKAVQWLALAAIHRDKAGQKSQAEDLMARSGAALLTIPANEASGLAQIADAWLALGNTDLFLACAERCLEISPERPDPRFDLAYQHAERKEEAEALFHYRQYLLSRDNPGVWNNIGVTATALKLPIAAIDAYIVADRDGNTLATSNLADAKLDAGFVDEAIEVCQRALARPDPDTRLFEVLARCQRAKEEAPKKEAELLKHTKPRREFLRRMGSASLRPTPTESPANWQGPQCLLFAHLENSKITMKGTYERPRFGGLSLGDALAGSPQTETVVVEYSGRFYGFALVGKVKTESVEPRGGGLLAGSAALIGENGQDFLGYLDSNATQLTVLEGKRIYAVRVAGQSVDIQK